MKSIIIISCSLAAIECLIVGNPCVTQNSTDCQNTVEVGVYIESICPDTRRFIVNQLWPTYQRLSTAEPPILSLNIVPFGNAQLVFNNNTHNPSLTYTCQHDDAECTGNMIQSCAFIKLSIDKSLALINCMFNSTNWRSPSDSAKECSEKLNLDYNSLIDCTNSLEGIAYQYLMAGQTLALNPAKNWIPWLTINGEHTDEIQEEGEKNDLLKLVCDTYKVEPKPKECTEKSSSTDSPDSSSITITGSLILPLLIFSLIFLTKFQF